MVFTESGLEKKIVSDQLCFSDQAEKFEKYYRCLLSPNKSVRSE